MPEGSWDVRRGKWCLAPCASIEPQHGLLLSYSVLAGRIKRWRRTGLSTAVSCKFWQSIALQHGSGRCWLPVQLETRPLAATSQFVLNRFLRNITLPIKLGGLSVTSLPSLITTSPNGSIDIHGHTVIIKQAATVPGLAITFQKLEGPAGPMIVDEYDASGKFSGSFTVPTAPDGKSTTYYRL